MLVVSYARAGRLMAYCSLDLSGDVVNRQYLCWATAFIEQLRDLSLSIPGLALVVEVVVLCQC